MSNENEISLITWQDIVHPEQENIFVCPQCGKEFKPLDVKHPVCPACFCRPLLVLGKIRIFCNKCGFIFFAVRNIKTCRNCEKSLKKKECEIIEERELEDDEHW